jgi:hypothetical protein
MTLELERAADRAPRHSVERFVGPLLEKWHTLLTDNKAFILVCLSQRTDPGGALSHDS